MGKWIAFAFLILFSTFTYADLSDFPQNFADDRRLNGYLVVGKSATSLDVISQSTLGLAIAGYIGAPQSGVNKLDDEVSLANNLILIGNPCVNVLTSELLGNPEPCDKDFPVGKAFIQQVSNTLYTYIVVAGHDNRGTKEAADYLSLNLGKLKGEKIVIEIEAETPSPKEEKATEIVKEREVNEQVFQGVQKEVKKEDSIPEAKSENVSIPIEKKGLWNRFIDWLRGILS